MARILLVDIGNTRIKWANLEGGRLGRSHAALHAGWDAATCARRLFGGRLPLHMWVTSVAAPQVRRALTRAARRAGVRRTFVSVPQRGSGVRVGYREPWRLGADRFVAMVGAHDLLPRSALCVVGVGTALTVDLLGADGRHRGGVIIPGPSLMVETLYERTYGIRRRAQGGSGVRNTQLFARSTRDGVLQGARHAAASLIDRAAEEGRAVLGSLPLVVLTGGGAAAVRPLLRSACIGLPDLVLRGLAVLAQAAPCQARPRAARPRSRA